MKWKTRSQQKPAPFVEDEGIAGSHKCDIRYTPRSKCMTMDAQPFLGPTSTNMDSPKNWKFWRWCSFHFRDDLSGCAAFVFTGGSWDQPGRPRHALLPPRILDVVVWGSWNWKKMCQRSVIENYKARRFNKKEESNVRSSDGFTKTRLIMRIWRSKSLMLKHQVSTLTSNNLLRPKMGKPVENSFFLDLCRCFFHFSNLEEKEHQVTSQVV